MRLLCVLGFHSYVEKTCLILITMAGWPFTWWWQFCDRCGHVRVKVTRMENGVQLAKQVASVGERMIP